MPSLSEKIKKHVKMVDLLFDKEGEIDNAIKQEIFKFLLEDCWGNTDINEKMRTSDDPDIAISVKKIVTDLTFRTRNWQVVNAAYDRACEVFDGITSNSPVQPSQKMTLKEYAALRDVAKLKDYFDLLLAKEIITTDNSKYQKIQKAYAMISFIENDFQNNFKFPAGSFILTDIGKKQELDLYDGLKKIGKSIMSATVSEYDHLSKGYIDSHDKPMQSHLFPKYKEEPFDTFSYLYSDIYVMDLAKLISSDNQHILHEKLGDHWEEILNKLYQSIERDFHDKQLAANCYAHLETGSGFNQLKIGLSTIFLSNEQAHSQSSAETSDHLLAEIQKWTIAPPSTGTMMICSEFVARTTIASLAKLNQQLVYICNLPPKSQILKDPISPKEYLPNLHPARFVKIMSAADCLKKWDSADQQIAIKQILQKN